LGTDIGPGGLGALACEQYFTALFDGQAVMAILRGMSPAMTAELCDRVWRAGISVAEVTIETVAGRSSLQAAVESGRSLGRAVGAGTVISRERVQAALAAGAEFTVAPGLDAQVAQASLEAGLPHLPGVATPTEVAHAVSLGFRWLKLFPARELGAGWISAMAGPFPGLRFVATGGIGPANAAEFLAAGARVVAVGGSLRQPGSIESLARLRVPPEMDAGASRGSRERA
jgi:2-dehydro-3-deoxyphosphogluconate aldolase / (4S)-4-hydroxy-2-oxoglutarate aldolase